MNAENVTKLKNNMGRIFIRNVTVLDVAVLLPQIGPRGASWYVDVVLSGKKDDEGIVLDFSDAKSKLKKKIDSEFDHRLLCPLSLVKNTENKRVAIESFYKSLETEGPFGLDSYGEGIKCLSDDIFVSLENNDTTKLELALSRYLTESLTAETAVLEVNVKLRSHEERNSNHFFSYTHSLKHHKGNCQRFHGHSNIVEVFREGALCTKTSTAAANLLANKYLVAADYVCEKNTREYAAALEQFPSAKQSQVALSVLKYEGSQGQVTVVLPTASVLIFPNETTIENISSFLHTSLRLDDTYQVFAYEGLMKGAISP